MRKIMGTRKVVVFPDTGTIEVGTPLLVELPYYVYDDEDEGLLHYVARNDEALRAAGELQEMVGVQDVLGEMSASLAADGVPGEVVERAIDRVLALVRDGSL